MRTEMRTIFHVVATPDGLDLVGEEAGLPDPRVVLITFDVPVSRLIDGSPELRELVSTLMRERDEAAERLQHIQEQLDQMATMTIREMEGWTADALRTAIAFERVTSAELREVVQTLTRERDEARYQLARSYQSEKCTLDPQTCKEAECFACGVLMCPHAEPMHLHHDGCPACYGAALAKARGEGR